MLTGRLLIVDDNKNVLSSLLLFLQDEFEQVETLSNPNQIRNVLCRSDFDMVLLDMNFSTGINSGNEGLYWLGEIRNISPTTEVVMLTAYGDIELAVKALKQGAADFIVKPWENAKLLATLKSILKLRRSNIQVEELKQREQKVKTELNQDQRPIVGSSPPVLRMLQMISKVARTDANVLITGENGTGKELVAHEIHRKSHRNNEMFVSVDMGAIPESLFESEFFGHKKGSFTDAREDRIGKFQLAHKGSIFLDEIGNLPLSLQSKLLSTLQNRTIMPVGSNQTVKVDIRLICATNCDLEKFIEEQKFREDLLYRINTICIEVPPLRDRMQDIEPLSEYFLRLFEKRYQKSRLTINSQAMQKMKKYSWPGNVRELQHTIEKAVILCDTGTLRPDDFIFRTGSKPAMTTFRTFDEMERQMIEAALVKHNGKHSAIAEQLGISRQTLYNKIKKYGL